MREKSVDTSKGTDNSYLIDPSQFWKPASDKGSDKPTEKIDEAVADPKKEKAGVAVADAPPKTYTPMDVQIGGQTFQRRDFVPVRGPNQPVNDMTYSAMSRNAALANGGPYYGQERSGQPRANVGANQFNPGQQADAVQMARLGDRRRMFPQPVAQPQERPPQAGERQRLFGKPLFGRGDAAPQAAALSKIEFNSKTETGVIKEMALPGNFKETPKDPNVPDDPRREYTVPGTRSRVTYMEGRELMPDEMAQLKNVLNQKNGKLAENTPAFNDACALMGGGFHSFSKAPVVSMEKFNGRNVIVMQDQDPQQKLAAYTMFIPSDQGKFLYQLSFDGNASDFAGVKKGFDSIKWRPTPDSVVGPGPIKNK